jgi:VCBS repeat-containing protein
MGARCHHPGEPGHTGNVLTNNPHTGAPSGTFADVADTDPDSGTTLTVTGISGGGVVGGAAAQGTYGTLTIAANGTYTYTLNASNPTINALGAGQSTTDQFTYTISDGNGGTDTATLTITIFGVNDAPDAISDTNWVLDVSSGANPTASGNALTSNSHPGAPTGTFADVADTDVDTGTTLTVTAISGANGAGVVGGSAATGLYGTLTINANGTYTYTLDATNSTINALAPGQSTTTSSPTRSATATAAPTPRRSRSRSSAITARRTRPTTPTGSSTSPPAEPDRVRHSLSNTVHSGAPSGTFADHVDTDIDNGAVIAVTGISGSGGAGVVGGAAAQGAYGTLTIGANGDYTYTLNASNPTINALGAGQSTTDQFTYTIVDGQAAPIPRPSRSPSSA